jgi:alpha,alpha-trehalose phosphorylase
MQAVMAVETGHLELAYDYFGEAALMDLDDLEHNTSDGLHIASLAGSWIAAVYGFGGLRYEDGELRFAPRLPERLTRLAFRLRFRGCLLEVEVRNSHSRYRVLEGGPLTVGHFGEQIEVGSEPVERKAPPLPAVAPVTQQPGRAPDRRHPSGGG